MKEEEARRLLSGAGGYWQVIDEVAMTMVIQQQDRLSCGPACGGKTSETVIRGNLRNFAVFSA